MEGCYEGSFTDRRVVFIVTEQVEYICEHSSLRAKTDTVYLLNVQKKLPSEFASKIPNSEEILDEAAKKILKPAKKALEAADYKVKMKVAYGKATKPNC